MKFIYLIIFSTLMFVCSELKAHDKWIVVTTIQYPTRELKKLASLDGWKLVVVGDKKTPPDWHLDNCIYLSPEAQMQLPYEIIKVLKWNHYCRKMIGYLYAIEHGAQIIYETDDDNMVMDDLYVVENDEISFALRAETSMTVNVYDYFGKPKVWPRGYPLEWIHKGSNYSRIPMRDAVIGVQQGLVDLDPDVDAIYRLTNKESIFFTYNTPCVIDYATYCPFNSQNTFFHKDAFWGLFLPATAAFRTTDILRSYITTRLLWELRQTVCFTASTAIQNRNEHDLLKDFEDELFLYTKAGKFIYALDAWRADSDELSERMLDLYDTLIRNDFMDPQERKIVQAWIKDLNKLEYEWPIVSDW